MSAALAFAVNDFFIGQHGPQGWAPIHQFVRLVGKSEFIPVGRDRGVPLFADGIGNGKFGNRSTLLLLGVEPSVMQDQEDPLRPAKVRDIRGS